MSSVPDALTGGNWEKRGLTWIWVPAPPPRLELAVPVRTSLRDVTGLIACPTCHAKVDQTCRTKNGHTTTPHMSRLTPRLCKCGALLRSKARYCPPCRREVNLANKRDYLRRLRARRRAEREQGGAA